MNENDKVMDTNAIKPACEECGHEQKWHSGNIAYSNGCCFGNCDCRQYQLSRLCEDCGHPPETHWRIKAIGCTFPLCDCKAYRPTATEGAIQLQTEELRESSLKNPADVPAAQSQASDEGPGVEQSDVPEWLKRGAGDSDITPEERVACYAGWTVYRDSLEADPENICPDLTDFRTGFKGGYDAGKNSPELTSLRQQVEELKEALGHYAERSNWVCPHERCTEDLCHHSRTLHITLDDADGYDIAEAALNTITTLDHGADDCTTEKQEHGTN